MTQIKGLWRLYLHVKEIQCHGKRSSQCRGPDVGNFSPFQVQKKDSLMLGLCLCSATRYSKAQSSSLLLVASAVHCRLALLCPCHSLREDRSADNWIFNTLVSVVILSEESCALLHVPQVVLLIIYYGKSGSSHLLKLQILSLPSLSPSLIASSYTPAPRGISHCLYPPFCSRSPWHTWNSITTAQGEGVASLWGPDTKCLFLSFRMTLPAPPLSGDNDLIISFLAKILLCSPDPKRS
ncbi:uncharacterized protein LOC110359662 isoform X2 [Columba livia]